MASKVSQIRRDGQDKGIRLASRGGGQEAPLSEAPVRVIDRSVVAFHPQELTNQIHSSHKFTCSHWWLAGTTRT